MENALCFEDLKLGDTWKSRGRTVTETDVVNFACLTGDFDPLHVDHQFASETPFRKPIAHGLLGLSFLAGLSSTCPAVHTVAFSQIGQWDFLKPIFLGDTIHAVTQVISMETKGRRTGEVTWLRRLVNQDEAVVQEGTLVTLVSREIAVRGKPPQESAETQEPSAAPDAIRKKKRTA